MKGIAGRVAIITGSASGIGSGLVGSFVEAGARVLCVDVQSSGAEGASRWGERAEFIEADLRNDSHIETIVARCRDRFDGIDFIINAAATYLDEGETSDRQAWMNGFDVNVFGHIMLVQQALPFLKESSWPSVVNFTSESARVGLSGRWIYPATKAAIEQVTRSQAIDYAPHGIRVNAVMPGWTRKPWHDAAPADIGDHYESMARRLHMLGRMGTLSEVADAVLFLCSEHAGFVTGSCLHVDGGHSALGPQGLERHLPTSVRKAAGVVQQ